MRALCVLESSLERTVPGSYIWRAGFAPKYSYNEQVSQKNIAYLELQVYNENTCLSVLLFRPVLPTAWIYETRMSPSSMKYFAGDAVVPLDHRLRLPGTYRLKASHILRNYLFLR